MSETSPPSPWQRRLRRAWKRFRYGRIPPEETRAGAARLRLIYERFRAILNLNDVTLQLIADIEDRLAGRAPFSLKAMEQRIQHVVLDVFVMIRDLNEIGGGRYNDLYDSLRRVYANIERNLTESAATVSGPLTMPMGTLRRADDELAGTKMANLGEAQNALGLRAPAGFVITTPAFNRFMSQNELWERAERLEEVLELYGPRVTAEACREVQSGILAMPVPSEVAAAVLSAFDALAGGEELLVAVRSSAVGEDKRASHAGQYLTELEVGRSWLLDAYRWVLASCYGLGPVSYRLEHGLTARDAKMAVGVIRMLKPRCSGIMFSRGFEDAEADRVVISATPGLSDAITRGGQSAEEIVFGEGLPSSSCLSPGELRELKAAARRLEAHFQKPQDVEWAIEDGVLFILQARELSGITRVVRQRTPVTAGEPMLQGGMVACPGVGAGPVFLVRNDEDIDRFPPGGVLVAPHSSPKFSRVMTRAAAIVTDRGSPTGHMAILAREFSVPTIVGLEGATRTLKEGSPVTVNATSAKVYDGILPMAESDEEVPAPLVSSPAVNKLRDISNFITPLHLIEPASPDFAPANCSTVHDIARFVHEKVFEAIFGFSEKARSSQAQSMKIEGHLPYDVFVLDVGGGLVEGAGADDKLQLAEIRSAPILAFLEGLLDPRIKWDQPRSVSAHGFLSVLGESMAGPPPSVQGVGSPSFAVISDRYMNFSTKAGYHFNTVDTYCGKSINKNYIHFRFEGGGAAETRRARRCRFLSIVLAERDFRVQCRGDILVARLEKYDHDFICSRLTELGRLSLCSRQLDMLMDTDDSPEFFARAFLAGQFERF
jgi:pyruvate,water dikinase